MESRRLDTFTRSFANGMSRRGVMKAVAVAFGLSAASALVPSSAAGSPEGDYCECAYDCNGHERKRCFHGTSCPNPQSGCMPVGDACGYGSRKNICHSLG